MLTFLIIIFLVIVGCIFAVLSYMFFYGALIVNCFSAKEWIPFFVVAIIFGILSFSSVHKIYDEKMSIEIKLNE